MHNEGYFTKINLESHVVSVKVNKWKFLETQPLIFFMFLFCRKIFKNIC